MEGTQAVMSASASESESPSTSNTDPGLDVSGDPENPDEIDSEDNIRVVMYYYPNDGNTTTPAGIFDCHICGQKFRVFTRSEQHYLKEHGYVVVKCGQNGEEPRISIPSMEQTQQPLVLPPPPQKSSPVAAAGKRRKGKCLIALAETIWTPKLKSLQAPNTSESEAEHKYPVDDTDTDTPEQESRKAKPKIGRPLRRRRGRPPLNKLAAKKIPHMNRVSEHNMDSTASQSSRVEGTDWEVRLDSPAPGRLKLRKGKTNKLKVDSELHEKIDNITPNPASPSMPVLSPMLQSPVTFTPSGARLMTSTPTPQPAYSKLFSSSKSARDSRYAKWSAVKEASSPANACTMTTAAPRRLELTDAKSECKQLESTEEQMEEQIQHTPQIRTTPDDENNSETKLDVVPLEPQIQETKTEATPTQVPNSGSAVGAIEECVDATQNELPCVDRNISPNSPNEKEDIHQAIQGGDLVSDADMLSFLARETGFGQPSLGYSFTDSISNSFRLDLSEILDDLLALGEDSTADSHINNSESELNLNEKSPKLIHSPSSPRAKHVLESKTPDGDTRKRKLFGTGDLNSVASVGPKTSLPSTLKKAKLVKDKTYDEVEQNKENQKPNSSNYSAEGTEDGSFHSAQLCLDSLPLKLKVMETSNGLCPAL